MKKFMFIALLLIIGGAASAQGTRGALLKKDTALYHPSTIPNQIIVDSSNNPYLRVGAKWIPMSTASKITLTTGAAGTAGTATLASGTVTVSTTAVTASSLIYLTYNTPSGTLAAGLGAPVASIVAGTSFVIRSLATNGTVNTADNSTVRWLIIN